MDRRRWTKEEFQIMLKCIKQGKSCKETAKIIGRTSTSVRQKAWQEGLYFADFRSKLKMTPEKLDEWRNQIRNGVKIKELAEKEGVSTGAIIYYLREKNSTTKRNYQLSLYKSEKPRNSKYLPCMIPTKSINRCFHSRCYLHVKCPKYIDNLNHKGEDHGEKQAG